MKSSNITVSIIVPSYNEERTIVQILERVTAQRIEGVELEVIVIDDGSTDGTIELLSGRPDLYTELIPLERNCGKGAAVKAGLEKARGDYVLFQDADLEYDPADYLALMAPIIELDADVVMGSRFLAPRSTRVHYFWHKVGNRVITLLFNVLNNISFSDIYSCYLLYRRSLVDPQRLTSEGWEQHAEILSIAVRNGKITYEVPISYHGRSYGEGKKIRARHVLAVMWMIVKMRLVSR